MASENHTQPNKPGGDIKSDGEQRDARDRQAVRNQGSVTPDVTRRIERKAGGSATPGLILSRPALSSAGR